MPTIESARAWYPPADGTHGFDHILRVYRTAERLALAAGADIEIVRAAALLHDAQSPHGGRDVPAGRLYPPERLYHHHDSAAFAREILTAEGWPEERIAAVEHAIRAHRFRDDREPPRTIEAQVLFDADKLDAIGAIGVARAIAYAAQHGQPAFAEPSEQFIATGQTAPGEPHSAYHEYLFKLRHLKDRLYTTAAREMASERRQRMAEYFAWLMEETAE